ncbi:MAG: hypothetical protein NTV33_08715 [Coprothermobacterota bacterium]|nr:hypothetical protein [Coprothermobacterota bacterium]
MTEGPFRSLILVEVPLPLGEGLFTYTSEEPLIPGEIVTVPLGKSNRAVNGLVLGEDPSTLSTELLKPILSRSRKTAFDSIRAQWLLWLWSRYLSGSQAICRAIQVKPGMEVRLLLSPLEVRSLEGTLATAPGYRQLLDWLVGEGGVADKVDCPQPGLLKRAARRGWLQAEERTLLSGLPCSAGENRELVWAPWRQQLDRLLELATSVRNEGHQCLILAPEASLAETLVSRLREDGISAYLYLGDRSPRARVQAVQRAQGEAPAVWVGHLPALFLPFRRLGGILVLQEESLGYRPRPPLHLPLVPAASRLAALCGARLALFSRAPSMESYLETYRGLSLLYQPPVHLAKRQLVVQRSAKGLSPTLLTGIRTTSRSRKRSLVYINRLGYAHILLCRECGETFFCPHCTVSLTPHSSQLVCHYCGHREEIPALCPTCRSPSLEAWGAGIDRLEEVLMKEVDGRLVFRLDAQSEEGQQGRKDLLERFRRTPGAILLTTSRLRGSSLPPVSFLAVLNADQALKRPSFRATERAFQLLTNLEPLAREHFFLQTGSLRGIERLLQPGPSFYRQELEARKQAGFPPHIRLLRLLFLGREEESVWKEAQLFRRRLLDAQLPFSLTGPLAAAYPRLQGLWRVELLARFDIGPLPEEVRPLLAFHSPRGGVHLSVELDPED